MGRSVSTWLGLKEGEGARTGRLFGFIFLLTSAAVLGRSAQRELFLAAYPRSAIPDAFLLSAGVLCAASLALSAVARRLSAARLMQLLVVLGTALLLGAQAALQWTPAAAPMLVYVVVEVLVSLLLTQGWAVAADALDVRSAKRLLPVVGLGAGIAWTVGGLAVGALARSVGPTVVLWLAPAALLGSGAALEWVRARDLGTAPEPRREASGLFGGLWSGLRYLWTEPLMRVLAAIITLELVVEKVTDFQLLALAQERFGAQPGGIASFMGLFYGLTGAVTLAAPLVAGRVLTRFGSTWALVAGQSWVVAFSALFLVAPLFPVVVLLSGGDRVLKQSLGAPARSQVFGALPSERRVQAGALLRGVLAAVFSALAAVGLKALPEGMPLQMLSVGAVVLTAFLAVLTRRELRSAYLQALQRSVDRTRLNLDGGTERHDLDQEQVVLLSDELASGDGARGSLALSILAASDPALARPLLHRALGHAVPAVRAQAALALGHGGDAQDTEPLLKALEAAPDDEVRRACLEALARVAGPDVAARLAPFSSAPDPRVRALARASRARLLLGQGGQDDAARTEVEGVQAMLRSAQADEREAAAWALGLVPLAEARVREGFAPLLADASLPVRRAAVGASGQFADEAIVRALVFALEEPATATAAFDAFARLGNAGVERVEKVLDAAPAAIVSRTASALSRGVGERANEVLQRLLGHQDAQVRYRASRALVMRRRAASWRKPEDTVVQRAIEADLLQGYRYYAALASLRQALAQGDAQSRFVAGEIDSRIQDTERRLLALVAVVADQRIARLSHHLHDASPQVAARVLELVEQSLEPRLAALVVPFLERVPPERKAEAGAQHFQVPARFSSDTLAALFELGDEHLRLCALLAFKEAALQRFPELKDKEEPLLHLVEKLRFLRSVPVFKNLSPEDLMKLAEIASPAEHAAQKIIFKKGDPGDVLCVVVKGRVEIRDRGQVIATQGPNDFFGELALFDQEPRSADAVCVEDTEVLEIGGADLDSLMERRPEIAREIIRVLAKRLRKTTQELVGRSQPPRPA